MIPMRDIQSYCDGIAAAFKPRKIILFGSYAYGNPTEDSDVDVMVVMPRGAFVATSAGAFQSKCRLGFPLMCWWNQRTGCSAGSRTVRALFWMSPRREE